MYFIIYGGFAYFWMIISVFTLFLGCSLIWIGLFGGVLSLSTEGLFPKLRRWKKEKDAPDEKD